MTLEYEIDSKRQLAVAVLSGSVTAEDYLDAMTQVYNDPRRKPGYSTVWDCRGIEELIIGGEGVKRIIDATFRLREQMGAGKAAFVVPREIDETMAKLLIWRTRSEGRDRKTFATLDEAMAWIEKE